MRKNDIRIMKMDCNNRSILMRALYADFCANREAGRPNEHRTLAAGINCHANHMHNSPDGKSGLLLYSENHSLGEWFKRRLLSMMEK